jgi:hypothetical protein
MTYFLFLWKFLSGFYKPSQGPGIEFRVMTALVRKLFSLLKFRSFNVNIGSKSQWYPETVTLRESSCVYIL